MVKTVLTALVSLALLGGAFAFETVFVERRFDAFAAAVEALDEKVREETATAADAEAVQEFWEHEKKQLHAVLPHGDIGYIDYWLAEAAGCIETGSYGEALSKLAVLRTVCEQIPASYGITFGNIF